MYKLKYFLIALLLGISTFTHLYRINHTFIFHNDEARDVLIVKKMIDTKTPVLLGPQTSVGNMYLGPLYYYLMLPALLIAGMDPVGPAIMVAIFGIATSILLLYIGTKRHSFTAGMIAGLFYSLTPVMLHYSRSSWNPNIVPFFVAFLLVAWMEKSKWGWLILGISAGAIFQLHYVGLVIVALVGLAKLKTRPKWSDLIIAIFGFVVVSSPFWLFELRHNFVNSQAFITFLREGSQTSDVNSSYLSRLFSNSKLVINGIVGSSSIELIPVSSVLLLIFGVLIFVGLPMLGSASFLWYLIIGSILVVSILKEPMHVHYISFLFPVISLALGEIFARGSRIIKLVTTFSLLFLMWHNIPTLIYNLNKIDSVQTIRSKAVADYIVHASGGRAYNIVSTPGTYATTIEYYLSLSDHPPVTTYENLIFDICDGNPCPSSDTTTVLFYGAGPTHPAIAEYLGHPAVNEFNKHRTIVRNELVSYSTWVATMTIEP
jgi:4-amino-4-deoxy-L-arabinose transferase-like glycosyltransferase